MTWSARGPAEGGAIAERGLEDAELRIVRSRIDLRGMPPVSREVIERIIRDTADLSYATDLICSERALEEAVAAIAAGAPVIADVPMVAAGLADWPVICKAREPLTMRLARTAGIATPSAAVRLAFGEAGPGAVWLVGSEPMAIGEIISRGTEPALVVGIPAGFGAAVSAKELLRDSGLPALTNVSAKGGPAAAVAGCAALLNRALAAGAADSA